MATEVASYEIRSNPATGNGIFALFDLPASAPVIEDTNPFVAVLDSPTLKTACSWCFVYAEEVSQDERIKLSACTGCKIARYCGKTCQASAWKHSHKWECKIYASLYPKVLPNTARMVLQLLLRRQYDALPAADWTKFLKLRHHIEDFKSKAAKGDETYQNLQLMSRAAVEYSKSDEDLGLVETLVGRLLINTLTLMSPLFTPLGLLLSLPVSNANHSCLPTAIPTLSGRTLTLRTLEPVPSSSELTISYTDITVPPIDRRADLQARYHFHCACHACDASLTLDRPDPPPILASISSSRLGSILEEATTLVVMAAQDPDARQRLDPLLRALALFPPEFPAYRPPLSRVRTDLIHALLAHRQWVPALIQSVIQRVEADPIVFAAENHPVRVARAWVLARLLAQVGGLANDDANENEEAEAGRDLSVEFEMSYSLTLFVLVRNVSDRAKKSHGEGSQLAKEAARELQRLRKEVQAIGGKDPEGEPVKEVWEKLERIAKEGWEWWTRREAAPS